MIPGWMIALTWFVAAVLAGAIWYFWDKSKIGVLWGVSATIVLAVVAVTMHIHNELAEREAAAKRPVFFGFLEPSNEQPLPPKVPAGVVSLLLGSDLQVLSRSANQRVLSRRGLPFLTIGSESGRIWISTTIADSENQTVVRIIRNEFQAFPERAFNPTQPDAHSLLVRDSTGAEVLRLRFLNPRRILISGRFVLPDAGTIVIDDQGLHVPGGGGIGHLTLDMTSAPNAGVIEFNF